MLKLTSLRIITAAAVLAVVVLAGCRPAADSTTENTPTTTPSEPDPAAPKESEPTVPGDIDPIADINAKLTTIESVTFEVTVTSPDAEPVTTKVWLKSPHMKTETEPPDGQVVINIFDPTAGVVYMYIPQQNTALRSNFDSSLDSPLETASDAITRYQPNVIGTETVDGKVCLVLEYSAAGATTTTWLWQEYGFPVKTVTESLQGTVTLEYRNIDFSPIPDSEFELPDGVQIMDLPTT